MSRGRSKRLIVNADGYGFTPGVNRGIEEVLGTGIVKSLSCTPNFGYLEGLSELAQDFPELSVGVHVNLSVGRPLSPPDEIPSLVDETGEFLGDGLFKQLVLGRVDRSHIDTELDAQVRVFTDMGIEPTHIDGHQNRHLYPYYFSGVLRVAEKYGIKGLRCHRRMLWGTTGRLDTGALVRYYATHPKRALSHTAGRARMRQARRRGMQMADGLITPGYADSSHKSQHAFWLSLSTGLPVGTWEVYCHPAYVDDILRANAKYVAPREDERKILGDDSLKVAMESAGVEIISFKDVVGA